MTGLDLESFLRLLRADLSVWIFLGPVLLGLGLLIWSCWGSRRALRKCLVLSLGVHFGLVLYGSTLPAVQSAFGAGRRVADGQTHVKRVRVAPLVENGQAGSHGGISGAGASSAPLLDRLATSSAIPDVALTIPRSSPARLPALPMDQTQDAAAVASPVIIPSRAETGLNATAPERRPADLPTNDNTNAPPTQPLLTAELDKEFLATASNSNDSTKTPASTTTSPSTVRPDIAFRSDRRLRPKQTTGASGDQPAAVDRKTQGAGTIQPRIEQVLAKGEMAKRGTSMPNDMAPSGPGIERSAFDQPKTEPIALATATPTIRSTPMDRLTPLGIGELPTGRLLTEIPRVYQPRLQPDRSARARAAGATVESELAVERALDWLMRHQDRDDGRWDAGVKRYDDGSPVKGDDDFTKHCPPGETCFGECVYWEADTALTGLALLTYLGAGYTHTKGRYAEPVQKGLDFLLAQQKPDGDLRGESQVVGMYCHAMATLALCEAFALTGDRKLSEPVDRALAFLVRARARDRLAWRYAPGAPVGDTSILGWVVMGLKSAKEIGAQIPNESSVRRGTLNWLDRISTGEAKGLARYQPWDPVTPTMTAEAWVCRQFMGVGGPSPSSSEAAEYLLRNDSDRGKTNVYYWYYATLALYQHGGEPWVKWNAKTRDKIVNLQRRSGHQTGSWDPDESLYGSKGGRIYCTTLAALTLEVYYRYLRLYDAPTLPTEPGSATTGRADDPRTTDPSPRPNDSEER